MLYVVSWRVKKALCCLSLEEITKLLRTFKDTLSLISFLVWVFQDFFLVRTIILLLYVLEYPNLMFLSNTKLF